MKKNHTIIEIAGELRAETEKAYQFFDGSKEVWIANGAGSRPPGKPAGRNDIRHYRFATAEIELPRTPWPAAAGARVRTRVEGQGTRKE